MNAFSIISIAFYALAVGLNFYKDAPLQAVVFCLLSAIYFEQKALRFHTLAE